MDTNNWRCNKRKRSVMKAFKDLEGGEELSNKLAFLGSKFRGHGDNIYNHANHIYFNDDITDESIFSLNQELRDVANKLKKNALTYGVEAPPIFLHITSNGGSVHAAFSAIDCIEQLSVPVHTVVDGFVASAGTLISIVGKKRYISQNAYMLIHEVSSEVWGKLSAIEEEVTNLKKIMDHIIKLYLKHTKIPKKSIEKILSHDVEWDAEECIQKGLVDDVYVSSSGN